MIFALAVWALWLQAASGSGGTGRIEGRVVSSTTGEGLPRATVYLRDPRGGVAYSTRADAAGHFVFPNVAAGKYSLGADKPGYLRQGLVPGAPDAGVTPVTLRAGESLTDFVVELVPQAILAGRVVDEEGEPVPYAQVSVLRRVYTDTGRRLVVVREAQANELGEFRAAQLPPDRYFLLAATRPGPRISGEGYAPTFYPGANDEAAAAPIPIGPGQQLTNLEIRLRRTPLFRIRGTLAAATAGAMPGRYSVMLAPRQSDPLPGMMLFGTVKQDAFEIPNVPPGSYVLMVRSTERSGGVLARQAVEVAANLEGMVVTLAAPLEINGTVRVEGSAAADLRGMRVALAPILEGFAMVPRAAVQQDGSFRLPNVARDSYRVQVTGLPEHLYLKSVRLGGQEVLGRPVEFSVAAPLEIVLAAGAGQIEGVVQDDSGEPPPACTVTLVPDPPAPERLDLYKSVACQPEGRFRVGGVAPGSYRLYAWELIQPGAHRDAEFLRPYEGRGVSLQVRESSPERAQLRLIRTR